MDFSEYLNFTSKYIHKYPYFMATRCYFIHFITKLLNAEVKNSPSYSVDCFTNSYYIPSKKPNSQDAFAKNGKTICKTTRLFFYFCTQQFWFDSFSSEQLAFKDKHKAKICWQVIKSALGCCTFGSISFKQSKNRDKLLSTTGGFCDSDSRAILTSLLRLKLAHHEIQSQ